MPSTYTTNNGLEKIGTGEQSGTWGDTTNLNFDILDQALDGLVTVTATDTGSSGSPNTLPITDGSLSDGRNRLIIITDGGDLGGSVYYQLTPPDAEKIVFLRNSLSGSRDLILFQGAYNAARDLIVPAGKDVIVKFSGTGTSTAVVAPVFADLSLDAATIASADINGGTIDGVTIGVTSVATVINVDNLKLDGNTLSSTDTNGNVVLAPNGDGDVQLDADTVRVGDNNNDVTITTNGTGDLTLNTNGGTNSGSIEIQDGVNTNIIVTANGTGKLELANGDITTSASSGSDAAGQDLTIQAGASTGNAAGGDMVFQTTPAGAGSGSVLNSYTTVLTLTDDSKMQIGTSTAVGSILDEDDMTSDSATALATQQSIKAYVDSQVGTVDTWSEVLANGNTSGATDAVITAGQKITTDTIEETTADAGVKVDTFTLKDNEVSIDAASGTDQAGTSVTVSSGQGTGTGAGGELLFKVAPAGSAGTSVNALATGMKLDSTKALYVDAINELTSAAGVTIDSVLLKDDVVNATDIETSTISANDGTTAINIADSTGAVDIDTSLNVDGTVTADGLTVDGDVTFGTGSEELFKFQGGSSNSIIEVRDNNRLRIKTGTEDSELNRLDIENNGDISFYDSAGSSQSFYWDAADERLGIGDTSPLAPLFVNGNETNLTDLTAVLWARSKTGASIPQMNVQGDQWQFGGGGTLDTSPTMTIDYGSNAVGIGTTSPSVETPLTAYYSLTSQMHLGGPASIVSNNVYFNGSAWANRNSSVGGAMVQMTTDGETHFRRAGTGASPTVSYSATIDASGNFLVGMLTDGVTSTGIGLVPDGVSHMYSAGDGDNATLMLGRGGDDGNILSFNRSGVSVGSIGALSGSPYFAGTGAGIRPFANGIVPTTSTGASADGTKDLGTSGVSFRDLYLSNAVVQNGVKATTTATSQTAIETFAHASHDGAKVVITAATSADTYVTELLIATNGTTAVATEYGQIGTGSALATYDVDISGADVRILATPASTTSTTFRVAMTLT